MAQLTRGRTLAAAILLGGASMASLAASAPAVADELALRRVLLSTGGVGYFEYEAQVDGDTALTLDVRLDQVDDVMKSVVVYDERGTIGDISLPGREPLREVFRDLPFGPEALNSPVALLSAMRGAEVRVTGTRSTTGRIVSVTAEATRLPGDGGTVTRNRVSLMTADGLQQIILEETDAVQFVDAALQAQLDTALEAVALHNTPDRRALEVRVAGTGERRVRVGYVIEAPLWKTSYRLTMEGTQTADVAAMQGWAILENLSGEDWQDVDLTVVSGNPVTFRQALYQSYFVFRPEIPVEVLGRVLPPADVGAVQAEMAARAAEPSLALRESRAQALFADGMASGAAPALDMAQVVAASSDEATTQVVFRFPEPVSLADGGSILLPVIARDLPAERLSLYQPSTDPTHPLASINIDNDSESGLPPGVLTLYERSTGSGAVSYVGDARLGPFPAGEDRMLSYAVDQKMRIDREHRGSRTISAGRIVDGILNLTVTQSQTTIYTVAGAAREDRVLLIEHPRQPGWTLVTPEGMDDDAVEMTDSHYRLRLELAAGETKTLAVSLQAPLYERHELMSLAKDQIAVFMASNELSPAVREAMSRLAELQAALADREAASHTLLRDLNGVIEDQGRLRNNLEAVPRNSDLHQRYLGRMADQEDEIDRLRVAIDDAQEARDEARRAVLDYVRNLEV